MGLSSGDDSGGGGASCAGPHGASHLEIRSLERVSPTQNPSASSHPSATHSIQLKEGFRGPFMEVEQHVDVSWDRDCGLLVLECDCRRFFHPQREQELLARGQLPQGLGRSRGRARGMRTA